MQEATLAEETRREEEEKRKEKKRIVEKKDNEKERKRKEKRKKKEWRRFCENCSVKTPESASADKSPCFLSCSARSVFVLSFDQFLLSCFVFASFRFFKSLDMSQTNRQDFDAWCNHIDNLLQTSSKHLAPFYQRSSSSLSSSAGSLTLSSSVPRFAWSPYVDTSSSSSFTSSISRSFPLASAALAASSSQSHTESFSSARESLSALDPLLQLETRLMNKIQNLQRETQEVRTEFQTQLDSRFHDLEQKQLVSLDTMKQDEHQLSSSSQARLKQEILLSARDLLLSQFEAKFVTLQNHLESLLLESEKKFDAAEQTLIKKQNEFETVFLSSTDSETQAHATLDSELHNFETSLEAMWQQWESAHTTLQSQCDGFFNEVNQQFSRLDQSVTPLQSTVTNLSQQLESYHVQNQQEFEHMYSFIQETLTKQQGSFRRFTRNNNSHTEKRRWNQEKVERKRTANQKEEAAQKNVKYFIVFFLSPVFPSLSTSLLSASPILLFNLIILVHPGQSSFIVSSGCK